jgi:hypothetical protein
MVLITRRKDPLEGERVQVLRRVRRYDRVDLLVLLPDGRKRMIPQAWTDAEPAGDDGAEEVSTLGTIGDLLAACVVVSALSKRAFEEQAARQSTCEEDDHAWPRSRRRTPTTGSTTGACPPAAAGSVPWSRSCDKLATAIWHILHHKVEHHDLGADYFAKRDPERAIKRMIREANALGMTVRFDPIPAT